MSEAALWEAQRRVFQEMGLDPCRVENVAHPGCPDVNYSQGWVELKDLAWPRDHSREADLDLRPAQAAWLARRWRAGGLCWVMARVPRFQHNARPNHQLLLWDGLTAVRASGAGLSVAGLKAAAIWPAPAYADPAAQARPHLRALLLGAAEELEPHQRARFLRARMGLTLDEAARQLGWSRDMLEKAEAGAVPVLTDDLLAAWES